MSHVMCDVQRVARHVLLILVHATFDSTRQESGAFDEVQGQPAPAKDHPPCAFSIGADAAAANSAHDDDTIVSAGGARSYASFDYGWLQVGVMCHV